jgi:hypothetical protein
LSRGGQYKARQAHYAGYLRSEASHRIAEDHGENGQAANKERANHLAQSPTEIVPTACER